MRQIIGALFLASASVTGWAGDAQFFCGGEERVCATYGASIFQQRCSLCHGSDGLGEGFLSLSIDNYPETSLFAPKHAEDKKALKEVIIHGGSLPDVSEVMPPWGDELTLVQIDSLVEFIHLLRDDLDASLELVRKTAVHIPPTIRAGRGIYNGRCAQCHGSSGEGDGRLAAIIKDPPPFNLKLSRASDDYIFDVISKGGAAVGRSARMPPWSADLARNEILSVIEYIKTFRK